MVPLIQKTIGQIFSDKLSTLKDSIEKNNQEGNLDGLFSKFALGEEGKQDSVVIKDISLNLKADSRNGNFLALSRIGYSLSIGKYSKSVENSLTELYINGLKKLKACNVFPTDRISFAYYPRDFLGIALGTRFLSQENKKEYTEWLIEIINKRLTDKQLNELQKAMYHLIYSYVGSNALPIESAIVNLSFPEICMLYWGVKRGYFVAKDLSILHEFQTKIIEGFVEETEIQEEWLNAVIYSAVKSCLIESVNQVVTSNDHVVRLLLNFESAMKRWPNKPNHKWVVKDEKDIQSILWVILRSVFDDVTDEDPSAKFGHRFSIIDFRIPSLNLLIEAKFIKKRAEFAKIENEIKIDKADHLATKPNDKIIIFIYDNSASVEEHQTTVQALEKLDGIHRVIIVSKPSHVSSVSVKVHKR